MLARHLALYLGLALMALGAAFAAFDAGTTLTAAAFPLGFTIVWAHESARRRAATRA